jgi:uncharacterized protein involved in outer membrane biogenesis
MGKIFKTIGIVIGAIVLLAVIVLGTIPLWFPVAKVKGLLVDELKTRTGRDVTISDLKFNIFRGFELKGFVMRESDRYPNRAFIKDDDIVLRYNLLALLARELVIDKFELVSPYVEVVKEPGGDYNFTDIVDKMSNKPQEPVKEEKKGRHGKSSKKQPVPQPTPGEKPKETGPSAIKNIVITSVAVDNGNFVYADYSKPAPMSMKILKFNFALDNLILAAVKPIGLSMDCTAVYNEYSIPVSLKSTVSLDMKDRNAVIDIASFIIGGINTSGKVNLLNFSDAKGSLRSISNTKKMLEILPPDLTKKIKDMDVSIDIINEVNFNFAGKELAFNDILRLENGEFTYKKGKLVEKLNAKFHVTSKYDLTGSMNFLLAGNTVKITADGSNIDAPANSTYHVDIYSPKFAVEYLLAMFPKKESKKEAKVSKISKDAPPPPAAGRTTAKKPAKHKTKVAGVPGIYLNLKADSIFYKDVTIGKTSASIRFVNSKLNTDLSMKCYEGSINSNVVMDINKETYNMTAEMKGVNAHKLIDDAISVMPKKDPSKKNILDDIKDKVYGSMNMTSRFWASTFDDPAQTIQGEGNFNVKNGKLEPTDTGKQIAGKVGVAFLAQEMPFDDMGADFNMAKGTINVKNFRILNGPNGSNGSMRVRGAGYVTVDQRVDFKLETDINPKEARQVEEYFGRNLGIRDISVAYNKDGWLPFDVRIYNSMEDKKFDYSQKRMTDNITRNLTKKVQDQGKQYMENKGKDLLKNLFGK